MVRAATNSGPGIFNSPLWSLPERVYYLVFIHADPIVGMRFRISCCLRRCYMRRIPFMLICTAVSMWVSPGYAVPVVAPDPPMSAERIAHLPSGIRGSFWPGAAPTPRLDTTSRHTTTTQMSFGSTTRSSSVRKHPNLAKAPAVCRRSFATRAGMCCPGPVAITFRDRDANDPGSDAGTSNSKRGVPQVAAAPRMTLRDALRSAVSRSDVDVAAGEHGSCAAGALEAHPACRRQGAAVQDVPVRIHRCVRRRLLVGEGPRCKCGWD